MDNKVIRYLENLEGIQKKLKHNITEGKREKLRYLKNVLERKITELMNQTLLEDSFFDDKI